MEHGLDFGEWLDYIAGENRRWEQWFQDHPAALDAPVDVAGAGSARVLLLHIFAVDLFFANACLGLDPPDPGQLPQQSLAQFFAIGDDAQQKFRRLLAQPAIDWHEKVAMPSGGRVHPSRRKMIAQAIIHNVRHFAQLATALRHAGHPQDWNHDLLMSAAIE
jgi:uncharacterized damage-inducible protein DinB